MTYLILTALFKGCLTLSLLSEHSKKAWHANSCYTYSRVIGFEKTTQVIMQCFDNQLDKNLAVTDISYTIHIGKLCEEFLSGGRVGSKGEQFSENI